MFSSEQTMAQKIRKGYAQTVHGKTRKLSAGAKRIAVLLLVAEAHELTMQALEPTAIKFCAVWLHSPATHSLMKLFTMPSEDKYAKKDDVIQLLSLWHNNSKSSSFPLLDSSIQTTIHRETVS